jgi:uncharacterized membrane protein SpoIIM required for sporulation
VALSVPTMMSTSLSVLAEAILGIAALGLIVELERTQVLVQLVNAIRAGDYSAILTLVSSQQVLGAALVFILPAALVAVVVNALASGFVYSAEFGSYWMALNGSHVGVSEVMAKFRERWGPMAWTLVLSYLLTFAPLALAGLVAYAMILSSPGLTSFLFSIVPLGVGIVATLMLSSLLIYTPVAVMADSLSGRAALARSIHVSGRNYGVTLTYAVLYFFGSASISGVASQVPGAGLSSIASVGLLIIVTPLLHLTKTSIYWEAGRPEPAPRAVYPAFLSDIGPLLGSLWSTFRVGLSELKAYALDLGNRPYHAIATLSMVLGWFMGSYIAQNGLIALVNGLGYSAGQTNPVVSMSYPLFLGINISFHNWQVGIATALSGVWFSAAPFATLFLNGALIGAVARLVPNTTMLAAAILPHGIIEIPSFIIAGSVGLKLGFSFVRSVRSDDPSVTEEFHRVARRSVYVVLGLAIFFLIAGFIEGNITPILMKMAGWG